MDLITEQLCKKKYAFKKYVNWIIYKSCEYENPVKEICELAFKEWENLSVDDKYINCSQLKYILLTAKSMNDWVNEMNKHNVIF